MKKSKMDKTNREVKEITSFNGGKSSVDYTRSILLKEKICSMLENAGAALRNDNIDHDGKIIVNYPILFTYIKKQASIGFVQKAKINKTYSKSGKEIKSFKDFDDKVKEIGLQLEKKREQEKLNNYKKHGMEICTPALKEAYDRGILTQANYRDIKNGGLVALEKYTSPSLGQQKIYDALEELYKPVKIVILSRDEDNFRREVNAKKRYFENESKRFKEENINRMVYEPESLQDELNTPTAINALEEVLGEESFFIQRKTLSEIFA